MSTTTPRTVHHVAPVPTSDLEAQIETTAYAARDAADRLEVIGDHLASIDATLSRAARLATVASGVVAGAVVVAAAALVGGEVRR